MSPGPVAPGQGLCLDELLPLFSPSPCFQKEVTRIGASLDTEKGRKLLHPNELSINKVSLWDLCMVGKGGLFSSWLLGMFVAVFGLF